MATATATRARAKAKAVAEVVEALAPRPLGMIVDEMFKLREQKRLLEAQVAKLEADYKTQEELLLGRMEAEKTDKASGKHASVSVGVGIVANVEDWDALYAYVKRTGNFQLFQRRVSDPAYRELMESGKKVPGVTPFTKKRINLRVSN